MENNIIKNESSTRFISPVHIQWNPKEDITTYELAQCMPLLMLMSHTPIMPYMYNLSDTWMRHFKISDPNIR